jgi:hypothetical protein
MFGVLLEHEVTFDGPTEKWIVWPRAGDDVDPREAELREVGIRVVGTGRMEGTGSGFRYRNALRRPP